MVEFIRHDGFNKTTSGTDFPATTSFLFRRLPSTPRFFFWVSPSSMDATGTGFDMTMRCLGFPNYVVVRGQVGVDVEKRVLMGHVRRIESEGF